MARASDAVGLADAWAQVQRLASYAADAAAHFSGNADAESAAAFWAQSLARQCADLRDDLIFLAPWLELGSTPGPGLHALDTNSMPTLRELAALDVSEPLVALGAERAMARILSLEALALQATALTVIDYSFLFDKVRRQLVISSGKQR